jgi:hypothetical protein
VTASSPRVRSTCHGVRRAIVELTGEDTHRAHYLRRPFQREPDFGVTSVNYDFAELLARAEAPR